MTLTETRPALYVGTYHKYNCGSVAGKWLHLDDYDSKEEFLEACAELHKDEHDPEFMFQDFEGFPKSMYWEGGINEHLFEWVALDEEDQNKFGAFMDNYHYSNYQDDDFDDIMSEIEDKLFFTGSRDEFKDFLIEIDGIEDAFQRAGISFSYFDDESYFNDMMYDYSECEYNGETYFFRS